MTPLGEKIAGLIRDGGPITVERYMALCLSDPESGYYITRDPFGRGGDFITAPEISQIFGELIGLWAAAVWQSMGQPARLNLVEIGPGRGTLMADALRAARVLPPFREALDVHLIETSPRLRVVQDEALRGCGRPVIWHPSLDTVPQGPTIVLANEFFDALPIRQFVMRGGEWRERMVTLSPEGRLAFAEHPQPVDARPAPDGAILERAEQGAAVARALGERLARDGGAALAIDYGYAGPAFGDTFQAVAGHSFVDPLAEPGEADLTAHVNFGEIADAASAGGACCYGPVTQRELLLALGGEARAERLQAGASPEAAKTVAAGFERLVDPDPKGMGTLFKALVIAHPDLPPPPGFPNTPRSPQP